jgi:ABC-type glycerol-3-phosphate transport system permease component
MSQSTALVRQAQKILLYAGLVLTAVIILFPLYQAVVTSLATDQEVSTWPPLLFPSKLNLDNYATALAQAPLLRYLLNSLVQSTTVMIFNLVLASLAGYAFAFIDFKFKNFFFLLFLSTMMIPWEAIIIPNYMTITAKNPLPFCSSNEVYMGFLQFINNLNIVKLTLDPSVPTCAISFRDSYSGLTLPYLATAFGTFLVRQFFMSIPKDLHDAAVIDGCGRLRFLITIAVPLARPALGTLAVFSFLQTYNQYFWPLLITNDQNMRTTQVGLAMLMDQEVMAFNIIMAGVVIILVPTIILFIVGNRQLIRGLTAGAVKG